MLIIIFNNYLPSSFLCKIEEVLKGDMPIRVGVKGIIDNQVISYMPI
jgi:hypothetical protein